MSDTLPEPEMPPEVPVRITDLLWMGDHDSVVLNCHADPTWGAMLMKQGQVVSVNTPEIVVATLVEFGVPLEHAEAMVAEATG